MPTIDAIIQYGEIGEISMVDEPNLLVQSLTITPARTKQSWKGGTTLATRALRYTDPILTFEFNAIISELLGLADQHPGTLVADLANFAAPVYQFDPERGIMVFEDPSRSLTLENPGETTFSVVHYPFVNEDDESWTVPDPA